ncbi:MAG: glycosyltransferase [Betaproteobacteria bacterium]|nr:MAG: glycosyltransferase [Betaproteobacteria bacterium]
MVRLWQVRRFPMTDVRGSHSAHIAIFARAPLEGKVKTRLIAAYGAPKATAIYRFLAERTFQIVRDACDAMNTTASIWIADENDVSHPSCIEWSERFGFPIRAQVNGDLGERMLNCMTSLEGGFESIAILGTDSPTIEGGDIENALGQLNHNIHWSLAIVEDGGYVLIASNQPSAVPFRDMTWSTPNVMAITRQRFRDARLRWAESGALWDIDEPADVERAIREGLLPPDL